MKTFNFAQRSPEWWQARRGLPTCSQFDRIMTAVTAKPASAQDNLISELIAESLMPENDIFSGASAEMEYGMRLEAEARCAYELEFCKAGAVSEVGFLLHDSGTFGGSPDALVGQDGGLEIKCPNAQTQISYIRGGKLPNEYRCQVHGYLIVTGRKWWDFFSYCRNLPEFLIRVERDEFTEKLAQELTAFCQRYSAVRETFKLPAFASNP